jgi:hypothetical protein
MGTLTLNGAGDIAQFAIGGAAILALVGAWFQLRQNRASASRARVYDYADRFNTAELLRRTGFYREYWAESTYEDFLSLDLPIQLEGLLLPNLLEEVAYLYNRKLLDRDVAAELLGIYVERLWEASQPLIAEARRRENIPTAYREWEYMQQDTPGRNRRAIRRDERRRTWRWFVQYWMPGGQMID